MDTKKGSKKRRALTGKKAEQKRKKRGREYKIYKI
jgi:hypothetical protein